MLGMLLVTIQLHSYMLTVHWMLITRAPLSNVVPVSWAALCQHGTHSHALRC